MKCIFIPLSVKKYGAVAAQVLDREGQKGKKTETGRIKDKLNRKHSKEPA